MSSIVPPTIKEHSEFTLSAKTKWELVRYASELEKAINRAIKRLDNVSNEDVRKAIKILRGEKKWVN